MAKKPFVPASPLAEDVAAANARNKGVARIGDTPLAVGGVLRNGKVEGLQTKAYNYYAPGKSFMSNLRNPGSDLKRARANEVSYTSSLPKANALMAAKRKVGK